jgi:hypothetical protein
MIFIVLAVDVTMMPYSASALRGSIKPRPLPNPHCATLLRPDIVVIEDAHHTTSGLNYPGVAPKMMPPRGRATPNVPPSSNSKDPNLEFPPEQHEWVGDSCNSYAFIKVATHHTAIARGDQSPREEPKVPQHDTMNVREHVRHPSPEGLAAARVTSVSRQATGVALVVVFSRHAARDGGDEAPPSTPDLWPRESVAATAPLGLCLVTPPQRWLDGG